MTLHFERAEYAGRTDRLLAAMRERELDAMLLFAQESMFWLTGYDTFGYCFFQCLAVTADGRMALLTRSADLRQAQITSTLEEVRVWRDAADARPAHDLRDLLAEMGVADGRLGVEYDTHGLTARNGRALDAALQGATLVDASDLVPALRLVKSPAEIDCARRAGALSDAAYAAAEPHMVAGGSEAAVLAAMQGAVLAGDGDYPGNEFIVGSGENALLCRYRSGRRTFDADDQLTLEWAGAYRHYHAAAMRTVVIGRPRPDHAALFDAVREALAAVEEAMRPGRTFGEVFDAHARVLDRAGLAEHRLFACGYSLGARFAPSWMEPQMFFSGSPHVVAPNMTLFAHMIVMNSDTGTAMSLGRTYLTTAAAPEPLNAVPEEMPVR